MAENNLLPPEGATRKCPLSIILIACLFGVAGTVGLIYHASEFNLHGPLQFDLVLVCFIRLMAVVGAVFMWRGHNWARWLLIVWLAYHIILSAFHTVSQVVVHSLLMAVIAYSLFRPQASAYFRRTKPAEV